MSEYNSNVYFRIRAHLFSPDEGSCFVFSTQNNWCEFLASYGVIIQSDIQSYLKKASLWGFNVISYLHVINVSYSYITSPESIKWDHMQRKKYLHEQLNDVCWSMYCQLKPLLFLLPLSNRLEMVHSMTNLQTRVAWHGVFRRIFILRTASWCLRSYLKAS